MGENIITRLQASFQFGEDINEVIEFDQNEFLKGKEYINYLYHAIINKTVLSIIGEIPDNWKGVSLKWISNITKGRKPKVDYDLYAKNLLPYLSMDFLRNKTSNPSYAMKDEKGLILVDEGDILILWDGSKAGEIVKAKKGILSSTMAKIDIKDANLNSTYLKYLLILGEKYIQENTIGMGIPHVSGDILKGLKILLPTKHEQTQIAAYLDYQTQLIDNLIEKKENLIQKLQEQRQAIINEAVTKGLNKDVEYKDSGIAWLGKITAHWEVVKLKYLVDHSTDKGNGRSDFKIALENIESNSGKLISTEFKEFKGDLRLFKEGDVLFNKLRPYLAKVLLAPKNGECVSELLVFRALENFISNEFLFYRLISEQFISIVNSSTYGAKMPRASVDYILNLPIPIPPLNEQIGIVSEIKSELAISELLRDKTSTTIQKLKDYRQSLISEVVTGKIDVRNWQQPNHN